MGTVCRVRLRLYSAQHGYFFPVKIQHIPHAGPSDDQVFQLAGIYAVYDYSVLFKAMVRWDASGNRSMQWEQLITKYDLDK